MNVSLPQTTVSLQTLGTPETPSRDAESPTVDYQRVATEFEGLFVSLLLKELRESLDEGIFSGEHSDTYGVMFDQFLGEHLAEQGGLGIRNQILSQISRIESSGAQP